MREFDFVLMDDRQHDLVNAETANRRYDKGSGVKQVCAAIALTRRTAFASATA